MRTSENERKRRVTYTYIQISVCSHTSVYSNILMNKRECVRVSENAKRRRVTYTQLSVR